MTEFQIRLVGPPPDMDTVGDAIRSLDPSAMADIDAAGRLLRVAAVMDAEELLRLLNSVGFQVDAAHVQRMPSICCGGCSG